MYRSYRSHGKHCYKRSFPTKCPRCGEEVLYWECTHGCKVFFEYPPYGKLIRHRCKKQNKKNTKNKYPVIVKGPLGMPEINFPSCPACGKIFKSEGDLQQHLNQKKKSDFLHKQYDKDKLLLRHNYQHRNSQTMPSTPSSYKPTFGKINIKEKK